MSLLISSIIISGKRFCVCTGFKSGISSSQKESSTVTVQLMDPEQRVFEGRELLYLNDPSPTRGLDDSFAITTAHGRDVRGHLVGE